MIWTFIDLTRAIREGHIWIIYGLEPHLCFFSATPQMRWPWQGLSNGVGPRCPSIHFLYQNGLPPGWAAMLDWMTLETLMSSNGPVLHRQRGSVVCPIALLERYWVSHGTWIKPIIEANPVLMPPWKQDNGKLLVYAKMQTDWLGL